MKRTILNRNIILLVVACAPLAYLAIVWEKIPQKVALHYNLNGEPDRFGSKSELIILLVVMFLLNIGVYLLLTNLYRIDPKKKQSLENRPRMQRLALVISVFISAITCLIVYSSQHSTAKFESKLVVGGVGLLFAIIGNYMYNIKPNYFAGIRTPWALENEENWRQTHKLAGKLWFAGGLILAASAFVLPDKFSFIALIVIVLVLSIIPIVYSYRIYARNKKVSGS